MADIASSISSHQEAASQELFVKHGFTTPCVLPAVLQNSMSNKQNLAAASVVYILGSH
jgi:hypothetical protein